MVDTASLVDEARGPAGGGDMAGGVLGLMGCRWLRTEVRRLTVYGFEWWTVMRLSNLTGYGSESRVSAEGQADSCWRVAGQGPGPGNQ